MARHRRNVVDSGSSTATKANASSNDIGSTASMATLSSTSVSGNSHPSNTHATKGKTSAKHSTTDSQSTHSGSSSSGGGTSASSKSTKRQPSLTSTLQFIATEWKKFVGCLCFAIASYFCYLGYLETRVNTPFDNQRMVVRTGLDDPERYWGSYRPGNYFGLKTRDPHSLLMGLMWYTPTNLGPGGKGIRHWCSLGDNLGSYGWTQHDGRTFGVQEIRDHPLEIETSFVKFVAGKQFGGDWTTRISVRNVSHAYDRVVSLIWYVALDERTNGHIKYVPDERGSDPGIYGETPGLGEFQVRFHPTKGKILHKSYLSSVVSSLSALKETVFSHFRVFTDDKGHRFVGLPGEMVSHSAGIISDPNFIAIHITAEVDFALDITYQSTSGFSMGEHMSLPPTGREYTDHLHEKIAEFEQRFERTFHLAKKGFSPEAIKLAKYALSNMVGSIGYFYGSSRVQSVYTKNPVPYWKSPLYTAVPSRSFFPRGFLWDEGFHGLLISSWDLDIELDIMCHWFDLLNVEGWIPREQILGAEALARVPEEFVIQRNTNANPPTFFLALKKILTHHKDELATKNRYLILERLYPRLQAWFAWFNTTQKGDILGAYQWRGRDATSERELNPKTLTSGLDDFPRASHPTSKERHVDLRCWIYFAASVMNELSLLLGKENAKYAETASFLKDNRKLNEQHISPFTETYSDWGLHTDSVVLKRPQVAPKGASRPQMVRVTAKQPDYKFVDSTFGYVNLFPFLLEILDRDSSYLGRMLNDIHNPKILWTPFGLRSLSKSSPLYMKRNTEHDPPYWRGPIWININYLALKALKHYGTREGPHAAQARTIYAELRDNIIGNILKEYKRTGYIWEQYDDSTGQGKGCNPFTGWSSLLVLIMSEQY